MAAQHIRSEGLPGGLREAGNRAARPPFDRETGAKHGNSRRNEPGRVQFPIVAAVRWSRRMTEAAPRHVSVLGREAVALLAPRAGGIYVDATFGAGGYSRAILEVGGTRVIGIDRDRTAIAGGFGLVDRSEDRLVLVEDRFSNLAEICADQGFASIDGIVMDVGVSSMQLDDAGRGFSFRLEGPLDMRMGHDGPTAADVVAKASEAELADIIYLFGEERHSRSVARAIVAARWEAPIVTTRALADIVARVVRAKPGDIHPATRTFQALRIFVNEELDELQQGLQAAERVLKPGGRLAVVSFHSLEDRIVKSFFAERGKLGGGSRHLPEVQHVPPSFKILTKRPVTPGEAELAANPRARSAKLRAAERTAAPALAASREPTWPKLSDVTGGG
jgi:16S rRNA (cytosine1402-N4)-methyltransferase